MLMPAATTLAAPVYLTSLDQVKTGYYRVYSHAYDEIMALSESATGSINVFCDKPNATNYMQVWWIRVVSSTETMLYVELQNAVSQRWLNRWSGFFHTWTAAMTLNMELTAEGFIIYNDGGLYHQADGHGVVSYSTELAASKWQIEAVKVDTTELKGQRTEYDSYMTRRNNKPAIIFRTNGGTAIPPITQDYGTPITAPANPTREGYFFMGWSREIPATMPAENITIWAKWQKTQPDPEPEPDPGFESVPEFELAPT